MTRFLHALIVLQRTYRSFPNGAQLHILIRFLSCPFLRVTEKIPRRARVLEIGAGHGVFSRLAIEQGSRRAVTLPAAIVYRPLDRDDATARVRLYVDLLNAPRRRAAR